MILLLPFTVFFVFDTYLLALLLAPPGTVPNTRRLLIQQRRKRPPSPPSKQHIMGASLSRLWSFLWTKKEIRILILGLVRFHMSSG